MSNISLILLIIAGVIALMVLHMTSSSQSVDKVGNTESSARRVKSNVQLSETPKKEKFSYSGMTDSEQNYNVENYEQESEQEAEQEQESEQEAEQEQESEQEADADAESEATVEAEAESESEGGGNNLETFESEQLLENFEKEADSENDRPLENFEQEADSENDRPLENFEQDSEGEGSNLEHMTLDSEQLLEGFSQNPTTGLYQPSDKNVPKAEFVIKSALQGNNFGGGKFNVKLTGKEAQVGPNTTNVNALSLGAKDMDFTLGVTPIISKEKKAKKLTAKDLLPVESKDDWFDMPYDKKQMMRIENENLLAGSSTQSRIGIDTQGQTLRNASHDLRACPPNPKFNIGPWMNSTIEPDYNIKPIM